nr:protein EFR3 homolog [Ipomoea batatas]
MHNSAEQLSPGDGLDNGNYDIQSAIENCILQLSYKLSSHSRNNSFSILAQSPRKLPKDRTRSFSITDGNAVESGLRDGEMRGENPNMDVQQCASSRTVDQSVSFKGAVPNRKPDELSGMKKQLLQGFSPDEAYPAGTLFMETPYPSSPLVQIQFQNFDEVLETARQVASFPVSSTPVPYDQVKNQCEALVTGKQEKMSVLQSFKLQQEAKAVLFSNETGGNVPLLTNVALELTEEVKPGSIVPVNGQNHLSCALESGQQSFRLPPSSPYDKFMKAARC